MNLFHKKKQSIHSWNNGIQLDVFQCEILVICTCKRLQSNGFFFNDDVYSRFECDRTVDYQFLLGLLRSDQLLHFPRRSHPTAGLATHLQSTYQRVHLPNADWYHCNIIIIELVLQQMAECARQCSIRGRHVPLQLAHRSHHIRCHLLPLLPRQIPKTRYVNIDTTSVRFMTIHRQTQIKPNV